VSSTFVPISSLPPEQQREWAVYLGRKVGEAVVRAFWERVEVRDGCWAWNGPKWHGYRRLNIGKTTSGAHRVSYIIHRGQIPAGMHVLHSCDNRSCCNPDHLFLGTNGDNVKDKIAKGRGWSKLSADDVAEIRRLYGRYGRGGVSGKDLAARFGVSRAEVSLIVNGHYWKGTEGLAEG